MKSISNILIIIISVVFLISSCTKEKTNTLTNEEKEAIPMMQVGGNGVGTQVSMGGSDCCKNYTTLLDVAAGEWCCKTGTNCGKCTPINELKASIIDKLVESGPDAVADFFNSEEWIDIFPNLESNDYEMLTKLQSGEYTLDKLYDPEINKIVYKAYNLDDDYFGLPTIVE